jgi:hypothetical protein
MLVLRCASATGIGHSNAKLTTPVLNPARYTPKQVSVPLAQLKPASHVSLVREKDHEQSLPHAQAPPVT